MISARSGETELTDILLTGENIDPDIQENVRLQTTSSEYKITGGQRPISAQSMQLAAHNDHRSGHRVRTRAAQAQRRPGCAVSKVGPCYRDYELSVYTTQTNNDIHNGSVVWLW